MRPKRLISLLAVAVLGLTGCDIEDWNGGERVSRDFHMNHPLKAGGRFTIESFNGSVEISSWDQDTVDISGTKYATSDQLLDALKIDVQNTPDLVAVRAVRPTSYRGNIGAKFVIKVPRDA